MCIRIDIFFIEIIKWHIIDLINLFFFTAFDRIPMGIAIESFDRHGLRAQNDKLIDIPDMTTVLHSLYVTIDQVDLPLMLDLAINWILNVYDSQRTGQIRVLSFKVYITIQFLR